MNLLKRYETHTIVNEDQQTYTITIATDSGEARVTGYIYDGEVFYIFVPVGERRQGVAKKLLQTAAKLVKDRTGLPLCFTSAVSPEGKALINYWEGLP